MTDESIKLVIAGPGGRMGSAMIRELTTPGTAELVAALAQDGSGHIGQDAGRVSGQAKSSVPVIDRRSDVGFDVLIDFTTPQAVASNLDYCVARGSGIVIGTTGLGEPENQAIADASRHIPVLYAANTSVGVNLSVALVEMATRALGKDFDVEIVEAHHRFKVDAPSGTALLLGDAAAGAMGSTLDQCGVFAREGHTGERNRGDIGFSTVRGGTIAGEHTVLFIGEDERIEITHRATDRIIFARGAIRAAIWLSNQEPGLYSMQDVLDLH